MKKLRIIISALILMIMTGCGSQKEDDKVTTQANENSAAATDTAENETNLSGISISGIDIYENLEISDWLDSDTVIVSKENESLGKMTLTELADSYPTSLYIYHLNAEKYELLKEQKDLNLGGAKLSPGKKNLLYQGNSLGDPSYYVLNMESLESFGISGEPIGSAGSAKWADQDTVIGAGYAGGAYYTAMDGRIDPIKELDQKAVYLIAKIKDTVYYNTSDDPALMALKQSGGEIVNPDLTNVSGLYPSPEENQMLVIQNSGLKQALLLCDSGGKNMKTIAEGIGIGGVSWSPDQRSAAYSTEAGILYIYDMTTEETTQIAADLGHVITCWSPSGKELAYSQWDGKQYHSGIVHLEYTSRK